MAEQKFTVVVASWNAKIEMVMMDDIIITAEDEYKALNKAAEKVKKLYKIPFNWKMYTTLEPLKDDVEEIVNEHIPEDPTL